MERQNRGSRFNQAQFTNREYRDLFPDVGEETIRRDFIDLVEEGLLLNMGDKKGTLYILK